MLVILARCRAATGATANVHAWRVPVDATSVHVSACGRRAEPDELEPVERFRGAPCVACLLLAVEASPVESTRGEPEPTVITADDTSDNAHDGHHRYGVALRGVVEVHLVELDATRGRLDGGEVVQTVCRTLAWGPVATPPAEWPTCAECTEIAAAVQT